MEGMLKPVTRMESRLIRIISGTDDEYKMKMKCLNCGKMFNKNGDYKRQKFCSDKCNAAYHRNNRKSAGIGKYRHICEKCKTVFNNDQKASKYCSVECWSKKNLFIIDGVKWKKCAKCGETKILNNDNFYNAKNTTDGFCVYCRDCSLAKTKTEEFKIWHKRSRDRRVDKARVENSNYKCREDVKEQRNIVDAVRASNDKWFYLKNKTRILMYTCLRKVKNSPTMEKLLGYTVDELKLHIEKQFTDGMTWEKMFNGEIEIDHKIPIINFRYASTDDPEFKKCWALDNIQPLWKIDNLKKGTKILAER